MHLRSQGFDFFCHVTSDQGGIKLTRECSKSIRFREVSARYICTYSSLARMREEFADIRNLKKANSQLKVQYPWSPLVYLYYPGTPCSENHLKF